MCSSVPSLNSLFNYLDKGIFYGYNFNLGEPTILIRENLYYIQFFYFMTGLLFYET